jgi:hypothetical protein
MDTWEEEWMGLLNDAWAKERMSCVGVCELSGAERVSLRLHE